MRSKLLLFAVVLFTAIAVISGCSLKPSSANTLPPSNVSSNGVAETAGTPLAATAESQAAAIAALVADLYKQHDAKKSPFFQTKNRQLVDKYFTKPFADLIWKDANNSSGEVGAIDGDPLYNAQDMEIKGFAIGKAVVNGNDAKLPVTFTNFGEKKTINYSLKLENNAWKIDNIFYSDADSLMKWLKDTYPDKPAGKAVSTEFEGKYRVGDTTCIVKPVKMAFEVRWAKGSGVEMFVFKEGYTFESMPDDAESNRFEFDDENYTTGIFYRSDGETFPVRRLK